MSGRQRFLLHQLLYEKIRRNSLHRPLRTETKCDDYRNSAALNVEVFSRKSYHTIDTKKMMDGIVAILVSQVANELWPPKGGDLLCERERRGD